MARLRRSDCSGPGIRRRRRGRGFAYVDAAGRSFRDPAALQRIHALAIPPAWDDVWICTDALGHLQATGVDAAGRKQYRYHDHWRTRRDREKFASMIDFGTALPAMRRRVKRDLQREDLDRRRVLACATRLLDLGFFRIGSEDYAERNRSYGLATLHKRHVTLRGAEIVFDYPAKSGQRRVQSISDDAVRPVIAALKGRRGGGIELLAFKEGRRWMDVRSEDINEYVKGATAHDFSAKDFRTWNATVLAAVALAVAGADAASATARKRAVSAAVRHVAAYLGNTPAVCRNSYIDPRVFDRYRSGWTIGAGLDRAGGIADLDDDRTRARIEAAVLDLLHEDESSPALERIDAA